MRANPETMCWRCNKVFEADKLHCPKCGATNGLVDFAQAAHEVASQGTGYDDYTDYTMRQGELGNPDRMRP